MATNGYQEKFYYLIKPKDSEVVDEEIHNRKLLLTKFRGTAPALLLKHFSRYGSVEIFKTYQNTASSESITRFAFVVFKKPSHGTKALKSGKCQRLSNGIIVEVVPACAWSPEPIYCSVGMASDIQEVVGSEVDIVQMPLTYKFDYLTALIDDCLVEIFQYLDIFELIIMKNLNPRFHSIVVNELSRRTQLPFVNQILCDSTFHSELVKYSRPKERIMLTDADHMLSCVGSYVTRIHLSSLSFESKQDRERHLGVPRLDLLMNLLQKYCLNGRLTDLKLWNFYVVYRMNSYAAVWQMLHTLELVNHDMYECQLDAIFKNCKQLVKLKLDLQGVPNKRSYGTETVNCSRITGCCFLRLPQTLKEFNLRNCKGLDLDLLAEFFKKNKQLEVVYYSMRHFSTIGLPLYGVISKYLPNLRTLHVENLGDRTELMCPHVSVNFQGLVSLGNLKYLKKLTIDVKGYNVSQLLTRISQHGQLQELSLRNAEINPYLYEGDDIKIRGLKILRIRFKDVTFLDSMFFISLINFLTCPELDEFHLETERLDCTARRLNLRTLWPGLRSFILGCRHLYKLFIKIPWIELNICDYHDVLIMSELRNQFRRFQLYISRQNISKSLEAFLARRRIRNAVELKYIYYDLEYDV